MLRTPAGDRTATIDNAWLHDGRLVLKFQGVDSISAADDLRGAEVCLPLEERTPLEPGEVYFDDLIGFTVIDSATGMPSGQVIGWEEMPATPLLTIRRNSGREILLPFASRFITRIDTGNRALHVIDLDQLEIA